MSDTVAGWHGERPAIVSVPNFRDAGGQGAGDGRVVRTGLVYRCGQLNPVTADDLARIAALGVRRIFDLRTTDETSRLPDQLPPGVPCVHLDVFADAAEALGAARGSNGQAPLGLVDKLCEHAAQANALLGGGGIDRYLSRSYRGMVRLPSARRSYGTLFASLAEPGGLPALFHCTAGKDRTGWAAAALLTLLGVGREAVVEDYLRSGDAVLAYYAVTIDRFVAAGGERAIADGIFGVKREYLEAAFDEMERTHGTIEAYFADGLGIDAGRQDVVRDLLLS